MINSIIYKTQNNKPYFFSISLLCVLTFLLNSATAIYQCALIFTLIAVTVVAVTFFYNKAKAITGLLIAVLVSFIALQKLPYYIDGKIINGLSAASFCSVMISMYLAAAVFQSAQHKYSGDTRLTTQFFALALVTSALIDGLIMGLFFIFNNNLSYKSVFNICIKELSYKLLYCAIAYVIIAIVFNVSKNKKQQMNNF